MESITPRENRIMIDIIRTDIKSIKTDMSKLANHYSRRLPVWATLIITILASLVTGLVVARVN